MNGLLKPRKDDSITAKLFKPQFMHKAADRLDYRNFGYVTEVVNQG